MENRKLKTGEKRETKIRSYRTITSYIRAPTLTYDN